jgi:hypothetical protein
MIAFFHSLLGVPAVVLNFSEKLSIPHHARTAGLVMFERYKFSVAKLFFPLGKIFWNDMGVNIDAEDVVMGGIHATKIGIEKKGLNYFYIQA